MRARFLEPTPIKSGELKGRFLVDANVLIYATLAQDSGHTAARAVLDRGRAHGCEALISVQNLSEMYPNLAGPKTEPPDTPAVAGEKIALVGRLHFLKVLPLTYETVAKALELCARYGVRRQGYFDMQLAATALLAEIPTIVTENVRDSDLIEELDVVNPFEG